MNKVMRQAPPSNTAKQIVCKKCKSTQITGQRRGFSFGKFFLCLSLLLILPIIVSVGTFSIDSDAVYNLFAVIGLILFFMIVPLAIILGLSGRKRIVNGCMNCGYKWFAGKK